MKQKNSYFAKKFIWSSHQIIGEMLNQKKSSMILDVGSANGFIFEFLNYSPKKLIGLDKKRFPKQKGYTRLIQKDIEKDSLESLKEEKFEAIVLADVLEHLSSPDKALEKLKLNLNKDAIFIISVPNMDFFLVKIFNFFRLRPKTQKSLFDITHKFDFTKKELDNFCQKNQLSVLETTYSPVPLPVIWSGFDQKGILFFIYKWLRVLTLKYPSVFAYQLIIMAKLSNY